MEGILSLENVDISPLSGFGIFRYSTIKKIQNTQKIQIQNMDVCSISQSLVNSAASKYFLTFWICVSVSKYFFTLFGSSHPVHVFVWQPCPVQVTSFSGPLNPHHNSVLNLNKVFKMFKYLEYLFLDPKPTEMCVLCLNISGWSTLAMLAASSSLCEAS